MHVSSIWQGLDIGKIGFVRADGVRGRWEGGGGKQEVVFLGLLARKSCSHTVEWGSASGKNPDP